MLGKIVDGSLVTSHGNVLKYDNVAVANPRDEDYIKAGYKEIIKGDVPLEREGFYISPIYTDNGEQIITTYEYKELAEDEA